MRLLRMTVMIVVATLAAVADQAKAQTVTILHSFSGPDGSDPEGWLATGIDGNVYGTTFNGGTSGSGTVFRISPAGSFTNLHSFTGGIDGAYPETGLILGNDGSFYGTTSRGGTTNAGTVFRFSPSGSLTTLYSFIPDFDVPRPTAFVQGSDGNFYGTTFNGAGYLFRLTPSGVFSNLHSFVGDVSLPVDLVQGSDGNLYGTTYYGDSTNNCLGGLGCGSVFRITPGGSTTNLYSFTGGTDGGQPSSLVQGSDGNFYGVTTSGNGTVFRITPSGALMTLYAFAGPPNDGALPAILTQGSDGYFYGITLAGGPISESCDGGCGTVFRISTNGTLTILHSFAIGSDGTARSGLVQGSDGAFYGTVGAGANGPLGFVFKIIPPPPEGHDLAIRKLTVPKSIELRAGGSATNRVILSLQNRSTHPDFITRYDTLATLTVTSLGTQTCPPPTPVLINGPPNKRLPVTLKSRGRLNISYNVIYSCANDPAKGPGHEDFSYTAAVHTETVDGTSDTFPSDDFCPRVPQAGTPLGAGTINDKGCGLKTPSTGQLGSPPRTDVVVK